MKLHFLPLLLAFAAIPAAGQSGSGLSKEQKIAAARRAISSDGFLSEMGGSAAADSVRYAHLTDAQLQQELSRVEEKIRTDQAHQVYLDNLLGGRNAQQAPSQTAARIMDLTADLDSTSRRICGNQVEKSTLMSEITLRQNPDQYLAAAAAIDEGLDAAKAWGETWDIFLENPESLRGLSKEQLYSRFLAAEAQRNREAAARAARAVSPAQAAAARSKTTRIGNAAAETPAADNGKTVAVRVPQPGNAAQPEAEVKYSDLYGSDVSAHEIQVAETAMIDRLPPELKGDTPIELQRMFAYGGFERLSPQMKEQAVKAVQSLRVSAAMSGRTFGQEVNRTFGAGSGLKSPLWRRIALGNTTRAGAAEGMAGLLLAFTQEAVLDRYDRERKAKWEKAYHDVAAEIPAGKVENVVFFEEVERQQLDMIAWLETASVHGYRGDMEVRGCPAEPAVPLPDPRHDGAPGYWRFIQVTKAQVAGTGTGRPKATTQDAYRAGCEMGKAAAAAKLTNQLMRTTYANYNQDPDTQAAFKQGYTAAAQGGLDCTGKTPPIKTDPCPRAEIPVLRTEIQSRRTNSWSPLYCAPGRPPARWCDEYPHNAEAVLLQSVEYCGVGNRTVATIRKGLDCLDACVTTLLNGTDAQRSICGDICHQVILGQR